MPRVNLLSDQLINKIAAGEVVERPASVVKELCENAIDAGARSVRVAVSGGGLELIRVVDDGTGMAREDAVLAVQRHATSKLRELDDLFQIATMGFRGEALPSIASVSRFALTTSERGASVGTRLYIEGGVAHAPEDAPAAGGTVIEVDELFFNTPARRKFLRREQTELRHCVEAVLRLALANPGVGFIFESGGKVQLNVPPTAHGADRVAEALDPKAREHLLEFDERCLGLRVRGYVAGAQHHQSAAKGMYTFVNNRFVRDRGVNHAISAAFAETLPVGRQPALVLFIDVDPRAVDVNVHPQKLEVRFADPRGVHEAVVVALRGALERGPSGAAPSEGQPVPEGARYVQAVERFLSLAQGGALPLPAAAESLPLPDDAGTVRPSFGQALPSLNEAPPPGYFEAFRPLGTLARRFLIGEGRGGTLVVLDPHAARERVGLGRLLARLRHAKGHEPAELLFCSTVDLEPKAAARLLARGPVLERLGIRVEPFGTHALALRVDPGLSMGQRPGEVLVELLEALPATADSPLAAFGPSLRILACASAAQRDGSEPTGDELLTLCRELDRADFQLKCTHSKVVLLEVPFLELERRAGG